MTKTFSQNRKTVQPVTTKLPGQVKNDTAGYVFKTENWTQLDRFLILGTTAPTYHAGTKNVQRNVKALQVCLKEDGLRYVNRLAEIDNQNLASHRDTLIYALAYALKAGDVETRRAAEGLADTMIRTGRDIAQFVAELNNLGGWGRVTRRTVANWYTKDANKLAYQVVKYRNTGEDSFSHRDILRLAHPKTDSEIVNNMFAYLVGKQYDVALLPLQIRVFESLKSAENENEVIAAIKGANLTHEMIPTQFKKSVKVWEALAENMPFRALVWNLSTFSELGMLTEMSQFERLVVRKLADEKAIVGSRVHPLTLMVAMRNYQKGKGERKSWPVNRRIVAALEDAMLVLFNNVEKSDTTVAAIVDVSGSMSMDYSSYNRDTKNRLSGSGIKPIEAAGALAAIQAKKSDAHVIGVDQSYHVLNINKNSSIATVTKMLASYQGGMTNLGSGIEYLIDKKIKVDTIVYYTDNEVNAGRQVVQLFDKYKRLVNKDARFVAVAFEANNFSVADPSRDDMLDVAGFDSNTVNVINSFVERKF